MDNDPHRILLTGATGYVGGRLAPRLIEAGHLVRCLARDPDRLAARTWSGDAEIIQGDVLDPGTLGRALQGIDIVYYLVHSLGAGADFHERDLKAARNLATAARAAGVKRIIYLGGLGEPSAALSQHLRSRHETADALREGGVPVTEFRAAVIVGSGSLSFEIIRDLTERLPVMICPRWVFTRIQPIAIRNVLDYLVAALDVPESAGRVIEIGGADVLPYGEMMLGYARARGLLRRLLPVPVLTPRLSSYWLHLVTAVPASIAKPLIEGLRNEAIVRDPSALTLFPDIKPLGFYESVRLALEKLNAGEVETSWSDALATTSGDRQPVRMAAQEGMIVEQRRVGVAAPPDRVFAEFARLGGERGWLYMDWAWSLRGALDRLVGGVGLRRGRRDPDEVRPGDAVDFWRVEAVEPGRLVRFRAEMKVPGNAWLQFKAEPDAAGATILTQTAYFAPHGLTGLLYWYVLYPIHRLIFNGMVQRLAACASNTGL